MTNELHYHQAKYDEEDNLTRECSFCGEDLLHESHIRGPKPGRASPSNPPKKYDANGRAIKTQVA